MKAIYEYTDTFQGESNYSWVKRGEISAKTEIGIVRQVKKELGLTDIKCKKTDFGGIIELVPEGTCTILFITFI